MDGDRRKNKKTEPSVRPKVPWSRGPEKDNQRSNKPVDMRSSSGLGNNTPALHPSFVHPLEGFRFPPLTNWQTSDHQLSDLINRIGGFEANLHELLRLPHHRFWSTVIFDSAVNVGLRSYINSTHRFYLGPVNLDERIVYLVNCVHKLVFKVYCRLSTCSEDPQNRLSAQFFGNALLEKKIFDIPLLMDIAVIYGNVHASTDSRITTMTETVLNCHPYFKKHLDSSVIQGQEKLTKYLSELGLSDDGERVVVNSQQTHIISTLPWSQIVALVENIVSRIVSISFFTSLSPTAAKSFRSQRFDSILVEFYETFFPRLKDELTSRFAKDARAKSSSEAIVRKLTTSRCCLVNAFRNMIRYASLDNLLANSIPMAEKTVMIDEYLDMISIASSSSCFSADYFSKYSFDSDICLLMEKSDLTGFRSVDPSRIDYLFNVIASNQGKPSSMSSTVNRVNVNSPDQGFTPNLLAKLRYSEEPVQNGTGKGTLKSSTELKEPSSAEITVNQELTLLVEQIKEFFPQLTDEVVTGLLLGNDCDPEKVIDLISTGEIPNLFN